MYEYNDFACSWCGGILLGNTPKKRIGNKIYHIHCSTKVEDKIKELLKKDNEKNVSER